MKSKSFGKKQQVKNKIRRSKSYDFFKLYESAAETKTQFKTTKSMDEDNSIINKTSQPELDTKNHSSSPKKNKKKKDKETLDLSNTKTEETNIQNSLDTTTLSKNTSTFTPNNEGDSSCDTMKSIIKNKSSIANIVPNVSTVISTAGSKSKKRNKSVSFMLEDGQEIAVKKVKSNDFNNDHKKPVVEHLKKKEKLLNKKSRKQKKKQQSKENQTSNEDNVYVNITETIKTDDLRKKKVEKLTSDIPNSEQPLSEVRVKVKKSKKSEPLNKEEEEIAEGKVTGNQSLENKSRKSKKKKRKAKSLQDANVDLAESGEPAIKTRRKELKPEAIAKGIESLNIGDNPHTLTNLLDEMSVVDKNKKKKERKMQKDNKVKKTTNSELKTEEEIGNTEEKEIIKWKKRKWNKDIKGHGKHRLQTSVVVENLPLKIMCSYKTLVSEHFGKFGTIAGIGVAETYPTDDPKPVFTTTVFFQDEDAATTALEEDNTPFAGNRIRVRRPLPATQTTLVVRAYAIMNDQAISTLFSSAGRIRAIRHLVKGKNTMSTAFVEYDGPEAVERALKIAEDAKVLGKKIHVSKYEERINNKSPRSEIDSTNVNNDDTSTV